MGRKDDVHIVSTIKNKIKIMNLIIPMAGMGKRMRPHTLSIPKPLIPVAGKPIVQRLVEDIARAHTSLLSILELWMSYMEYQSLSLL